MRNKPDRNRPESPSNVTQQRMLVVPEGEPLSESARRMPHDKAENAIQALENVQAFWQINKSCRMNKIASFIFAVTSEIF